MHEISSKWVRCKLSQKTFLLPKFIYLIFIHNPNEKKNVREPKTGYLEISHSQVVAPVEYLRWQGVIVPTHSTHFPQ